MLHRDAGAEHQRVKARQLLLRVLLAQHEAGARRLQAVQRAVKIRLGLAVADGHLGAPLQKQLRRRDAAAGHAKYENLFLVHHNLSPD